MISDKSIVADDHVPRPLRELRGWLVWRRVLDGKKVRKLPFYAEGGARKAHGTEEDRARLATLEQAIEAARLGGFDGIGLATLPEFGIVALDFDHCVRDGVVDPKIETLVVGTYAELSPSGNGVRAFFRGALPDRKTREVEVFHSAGFVTLTGRALDHVGLTVDPDDIAPVSDAIRALVGPSRDVDEQGGATAALGIPLERIRDAIRVVPADLGYAEWINVGMALHHEFGGSEAGLDLWNEWSATGETYQGRADLAAHWRSFGRDSGRRSVTIRSVADMVAEHGGSLDLAVPATAEEFPIVKVAERPLPAFKRDGKGKIDPSRDNVRQAVARSDLVGLRLGLDTFRDSIMAAAPGTDEWRPFEDVDYTAMALMLETGMSAFRHIPTDRLREVVAWVANAHRFDSAQVWLTSLEWDGTPRIETFLRDCFGAEDSPYSRAVSLYLWTALAGRILEPGVKADMVPVAVGAQGAGKSRTVAALVPAEDFFLELDLSNADADLARQMRGKLVVELGELRGLRRREVDELKAFISRRFDKWIPKYREHEVQYPRRCIFVGTTNRQEFLSDDTGHRRWLPFDVGQCDPERAAVERDQLWAEGAVLFGQGGVRWDGAEMLARTEHERYVEHDPWEERVASVLAGDPELGVLPWHQRGPFTAVDVLRDGLGMDDRAISKRDKDRMSATLVAMGYVSKLTRRDGARIRAYTLPGAS